MPVLRTVKTYRHRGRKRFIRLYRAWWNMKDRVAGVQRAGNGSRPWLGLDMDPAWAEFEAFRAWALGAGYSRVRRSLDREDDQRGYWPDNCTWTTVERNSAHSGFLRPPRDPFDMGGRPMRVAGDECPF